MKKRKFIIKIYKDYDWEIKLKSLSDYALYPELQLEVFSIERQTSDRKIVYLFDAVIEEDSILLVKEDDRFKEECNFEVIFDDGSGEELNTSFDGTFIDALEYIKKEFNTE